MTKPSPSNDRGHARRVIVTFLITTTAAAVTAGVALQKHPHGEAVVQAADASPAAMSSSDPSLPGGSRRTAALHRRLGRAGDDVLRSLSASLPSSRAEHGGTGGRPTGGRRASARRNRGPRGRITPRWRRRCMSARRRRRSGCDAPASPSASTSTNTSSTAAQPSPRASSASTSMPSSRRSSCRTRRASPLIVLMHGDRQVSTKNLARAIGTQERRALQPRRRRAGERLPGRRHVPVRRPERQCGSTVEATGPRPPSASSSTAGGAATWSASRRACSPSCSRRRRSRARSELRSAEFAPCPLAPPPYDLPPCRCSPRWCGLPDRLAVVRRHRQPRDGAQPTHGPTGRATPARPTCCAPGARPRRSSRSFSTRSRATCRCCSPLRFGPAHGLGEGTVALGAARRLPRPPLPGVPPLQGRQGRRHRPRAVLLASTRCSARRRWPRGSSIAAFFRYRRWPRSSLRCSRRSGTSSRTGPMRSRWRCWSSRAS